MSVVAIGSKIDFDQLPTLNRMLDRYIESVLIVLDHGQNREAVAEALACDFTEYRTEVLKEAAQYLAEGPERNRIYDLIPNEDVQ